MNKPSVVKAFEEGILQPYLQPLGFKRYGNKRYGRIRGHICQQLFLHVETRLSREFRIEYAAKVICQPHEFDSLDPGGQLPSHRAGSESSLKRSIELTASSISALTSWYEQSITPTRFLQVYNAFLTERPVLKKNGHSAFTFACGYAALGDCERSIDWAEQAEADFETIYAENPMCDWAVVGADQSRTLKNAVKNGTSAELLETWREFTITQLKLQSLLLAAYE
jgi:hypothetical protein